jgi:hypothetical protein
LTIGFEGFQPIGIDALLGKTGQFGQEFMSRFCENLLGLVPSAIPTMRRA